MLNSADPFIAYANALIRLGHDRLWIMHNEPALRRRFEMDETPFPPTPAPETRQCDRYEEL